MLRLTILSIFLATTLWAGTLSYGGDLVSRYIWRGLDLGTPVDYHDPQEWRNNTPAFQPMLRYLDDSGFSFGLWSSVGLGPASSQQVDEIEFTTAYEQTTATTGYKLYYAYYTYPSKVLYFERRANMHPAQAITFTDSSEIGLTFSILNQPFAPFVTLAYDYDQNLQLNDASQYMYTELGCVLPPLPGEIQETATLGLDGTKTNTGFVSNASYKLATLAKDGWSYYLNLYLIGKTSAAGGSFGQMNSNGSRQLINNDPWEIVFGVNYLNAISF
jgi:hypothetical protein